MERFELARAPKTYSQEEILALLAGLARKWTRGESTSLREEKAREMLESILFVIGLRMRAGDAPESAAQAFTEGLSLYRRKMAFCRRTQEWILANLFQMPNHFYALTIREGINGFFKLYDPEFAAQRIHITADYPIYPGRPKAEGIVFIERYLRAIEAENDFLTHFSPANVDRLLCAMGSDYRSAPVNLFGPVLAAALGLTLAGKTPRALNLRDGELEALNALFAGKEREEIREILAEALQKLTEQLGLAPHTARYARQALAVLSVETEHAVSLGTLETVYLIPAAFEAETPGAFVDGEHMDDRRYARLLEEIAAREEGTERAAFALAHCESLADLLDLICDAELSAQEVRQIVRSLPEAEITALRAQYPTDAFLTRPTEQAIYDALQDWTAE